MGGQCCLQIAVCSRKPELPPQSTVLCTNENPPFHTVSAHLEPQWRCYEKKGPGTFHTFSVWTVLRY